MHEAQKAVNGLQGKVVRPFISALSLAGYEHIEQCPIAFVIVALINNEIEALALRDKDFLG